MKPRDPFAAAIAATLVVPLSLAGCAGGSSDDEVAARIESAVTSSVPHAMGAFASLAFSGASNRTVLVNVYLDSDDPAVVGEAVDTAFDVVWSIIPVKPVTVSVGAVIGEKPQNPQPFDPEGLDMAAVASEIGIDIRHVVDRQIMLDHTVMEARYGAWKEAALRAVLRFVRSPSTAPRPGGFESCMLLATSSSPRT